MSRLFQPNMKNGQRSTDFAKKRSRRARLNERRGSTLVEAALVLPVLLLFLFGIFEYGRYLMTLQLVNNAARDACRYAVTNSQPVTIGSTTYGATTADVTNLVTTNMAGVTLQSQSTQVYMSDALGNNIGTWTSAQSGQRICVNISGNFQVMASGLLFLPSTIPVQVKCVMRCEAN